MDIDVESCPTLTRKLVKKELTGVTEWVLDGYPRTLQQIRAPLPPFFNACCSGSLQLAYALKPRLWRSTWRRLDNLSKQHYTWTSMTICLSSASAVRVHQRCTRAHIRLSRRSRLTTDRRVHQPSGRIYHLTFNPPKVLPSLS